MSEEEDRWLDGVRVWTDEDERGLERYVQFVSRHLEAIGPLGNANDGEIQILVEKVPARNALIAFRQRLRQKPGGSFRQALEKTRIGVMYEDQYVHLVRFPVLFPPKDREEPIPGTYITCQMKALFGQERAVCAMPMLQDGTVIFIKTYRHALRAWTLEFPRGGVATAKGIIEALMQEVREEAGLEIGEVVSLGKIDPDSGILAGPIPVFLARVTGVVASEKEDSEAISGILPMRKELVEEFLMMQRYAETLSDGTRREYRLAGGFENYAWLQAKLRGLV